MVLGISSTLLLSIILVPTLAWMLKYNKRTNPTMWKNIGKIPVKGFIIIVLIFGSSSIIVGSMKKNIIKDRG